MNRLSSHNKYILKEGKYVLQSAADQQLFSHRARSDFNESVDSAKDCPVKDNELGRKQCGSARQPLPADMTASAILPRKLDYLPKHFASKKIGKDLLTGSVNHSPLKLDAQLHSSRLEQPLKLLRSPFDYLPIDTKSNDSDEECMEANPSMASRLGLLGQVEATRARMFEYAPNSHRPEQSGGAGSLLEAHRLKVKKESGDKYRMSPQQYVVWLKRMLEDRSVEMEKLHNYNYSLQTEISFLKERIGSFQRANHVLYTENARIKMQLFSEEELMELCCPEQNLLGDYKVRVLSESQLYQYVERLKQYIHQLETQGLNSDTRSEVLNHKAGTHTNYKIIHLKKVLAERKSILEAHHMGCESKYSMKRYLANIIERTKADHKIIAQLRNEVTGKEKIISEMDQLITEISMQLASYKNELQKVELEGGATRSKPSKSMRESMITNATTTAAGIESRLNSNALALLSHGASPNGMKSEDELSLSQVAEEAPKIRRKLDWDIEDSDETIRKLRHEASERERLIEHYQSEIMRLSYETHRKSRGKYDPLLTEIEEVDYSPKVNKMMSGLLKMKEKKITGGVDGYSRVSVISVKRASLG